MIAMEPPLNKTVIAGVLKLALARGIDCGLHRASRLMNKQINPLLPASKQPLKDLLIGLNGAIFFFEELGYSSIRLGHPREPSYERLRPSNEMLSLLNGKTYRYGCDGIIRRDIRQTFRILSPTRKQPVTEKLLSEWRSDILTDFFPEIGLILGVLMSGGLMDGKTPFPIECCDDLQSRFWQHFYFKVPKQEAWNIALEELTKRTIEPRPFG